MHLNEVGSILADDELDWFVHYLSEGLYFEDHLKGIKPDRLRLLTYTTDIDSYYLYVIGDRVTPAPKPTQRMPDLFRTVMNELEASGAQGYVGVSMTLLELGSKERKQDAKYLQRVNATRSGRDATLHDFKTIVFTDAGFGLTFMGGKDISPQDLFSRLNEYVTLKKYQQRCYRWVGIGSITRLPGIIHVWVILESPWTQDPEMDRLMEALPSSKQE